MSQVLSGADPATAAKKASRTITERLDESGE